MRAAVLASCALAACVPSRDEVWGPVAQSVRERAGVGVAPEWRDGTAPSPAIQRHIDEILAKPLTADGAATVAVLASPELQATYAELGVAAGAVGSARALPNPQLEAQIRFPVDADGTQVELRAAESLGDLLAIAPRTGEANGRLRATRRRAVAATVDTAARAREAFYAAVAAQQILVLRRTIAEAAGASAELARSLRAAGNIAELELARETIFAEEAQVAVHEAEVEAAATRERLAATLGVPSPRLGLAAELPPPPEAAPSVGTLEQDAATASLELDALRNDLEAAGERIGAARLKSFVPDLSVGVSAKDEHGWGVGPLVALSLPIFDWGQGARAAAWAELRRKQQQYIATTLELRADARAAGARLSGAHQRAMAYHTRLLPQHEHLLDESVKQYNAMNVDAFELLATRREAVEVEVRYIQALRDYWVAATDVNQLRSGSSPRAAHMEETP